MHTGVYSHSPPPILALNRLVGGSAACRRGCIQQGYGPINVPSGGGLDLFSCPSVSAFAEDQAG